MDNYKFPIIAIMDALEKAIDGIGTYEFSKGTAVAICVILDEIDPDEHRDEVLARLKFLEDERMVTLQRAKQQGLPNIIERLIKKYRK